MDLQLQRAVICLLLALVFAVAQSTRLGGLSRSSSSHHGRSDLHGLGMGSQGYGLGRRPEYQDSHRRDHGNFYGGYRDRGYHNRGSFDSMRDLQHSMRPGRYHSGFRAPLGAHNQPFSRFQDLGYDLGSEAFRRGDTGLF